MAGTKNMTKGKPVGLLIGFAVPLMLGNVFQLLYTVADSTVVGRLIGVTAFAAVGSAGFYYWLAFDVILGLTQGFGTLLAQRFGADDLPGFRKTLAMALLLSCVFGVLLSCAFALPARTVLTWLNTPADIIDDTVIYLHIILGGVIITFIYNTLSAVLRAAGDSKTSLYAMICASIINIVLDIVLVLVMHSVAAVAIATVVAQIFACGFCLRAIFASKEMRLSLDDWKIDRDKIKALLGLGAPMAFRNFVISLGLIPVQYVINSYGAIFVAGIAAPKKLYGLMDIMAGAMEAAVVTYVAQNYGAGRLDRIKSGVRSAGVIMLISAAVTSALLILFGRNILGLMMSGENAAAAIDFAVGQLTVMAAFLPTLYLLFLYRSSLQGMGNTFVPMLAGFMELALRVAVVLILPIYLKERGVYFAEVAGWPFCALMLFIAYRVVYRKNVERLTKNSA